MLTYKISISTNKMDFKFLTTKCYSQRNNQGSFFNINPDHSYQSRNMIKTHIVTKITQLNVKQRSDACQLCLRFAWI